MNKLLAFLIFFTSIKLTAQNNAIVAVYYNFSHMTDTTMPDKLYKEVMQLQVSPTCSKYFSNEKAEADSAKNAYFQSAIKKAEQEGTIPSIDFRGLKKATAEIFYKQTENANVQIQKEFNKVDYLFEDPAKQIDWKIEEETKQIGNLNCQKATGYFRGRTYIAWFCAELPYSFGPWKLHGLPGLIIEAEDVKGQVKFSLNKIENCAEKNIPVALPTNVSNVTKKEFEQMLKSYRDALFGGAGADGLTFKVTKSANNGGYPRPNNPIELFKD